MKVGDKVRIKSNLRVGDVSNGIHFINDMEKYCGEIATISNIRGECFEIDKCGWNWSREWLEPVEDNETPQFKIGDKVRIRDIKIGAISNGGMEFTGSMKEWIGRECRVTCVYDDGGIEVDDDEVFGGEWVDLITEEKPKTFENKNILENIFEIVRSKRIETAEYGFIVKCEDIYEELNKLQEN